MIINSFLYDLWENYLHVSFFMFQTKKAAEDATGSTGPNAETIHEDARVAAGVDDAGGPAVVGDGGPGGPGVFRVEDGYVDRIINVLDLHIYRCIV